MTDDSDIMPWIRGVLKMKEDMTDDSGERGEAVQQRSSAPKSLVIAAIHAGHLLVMSSSSPLACQGFSFDAPCGRALGRT